MWELDILAVKYIYIRRLPLTEQEQLTLSEKLSLPPVFVGVRATQSLVLCVSFCRSLFVLVSFFFVLSVVLQFTAADYMYLFGIFKLFMIFVDFKHLIMISSLFDGCKLIRQKKGSVRPWSKFWCLEWIEIVAHDAFLE